MTKIPMESWLVKARPDLPEYELSTIDARPGSTETATEDHHLWRRSFGKHYRESWWVEHPDGYLIPNRVMLSQASHEAVERGGHRIVCVIRSGGIPAFYWLAPEALEKMAARDLNPYEFGHQYGLYLSPQPGEGASPHGDMQLDVEGGETPHDDVTEAHTHKAGEVPEGSTCPTCERRVPRKKKSDSPATQTISYRSPIGDVETHKEVLAAASEHMGIGTKKGHWMFQTITSMAAIVLQLPSEDVTAK